MDFTFCCFRNKSSTIFLSQESEGEEFSDVDEDSPPRSKKSRRDADLPKKTKKKSVAGDNTIWEKKYKTIFSQSIYLKIQKLSRGKITSPSPKKVDYLSCWVNAVAQQRPTSVSHVLPTRFLNFRCLMIKLSC